METHLLLPSSFWVGEIWCDTALVFLNCGTLSEVSDYENFRDADGTWLKILDDPFKCQRISARFHGPFATESEARGVMAPLVPRVVWKRVGPETVVGHKKGPIVCVETAKIYESAADACRAFGAHKQAMSQHLKGNPNYRSVKRHSFRYLSSFSEEWQQKYLKHNSIPVQTVIAPETSVIQPVVADAPEPQRQPGPKTIINLATERIFQNVDHACDTFGLEPDELLPIVETTHNHQTAVLWYVEDCPQSLLPERFRMYGKPG